MSVLVKKINKNFTIVLINACIYANLMLNLYINI